MKRWLAKLKARLWDERLPEVDVSDSSLIVIRISGDKPAFRRSVEALWAFWLENWKWLITTTIALAGVLRYLGK